MKQHFYLDPETTFLNFGSFGACNKPVMQNYQELQLECERNPVQFTTVKAPVYMEQSREALGKYIGCDAQDVLLVTNPSYAVNLVAKNWPLQAGDEILTTNIEYGACDKTWRYYCEQKGARYVQQPISLPLTSAEVFVEEFFRGVSAKTKLIFLSHITSSTALKLPVEQIIQKAKSMGIPTFIDGAHAPGHIPLNLKELGCDFYSGACHKWMMTPKGCSFFYAHPTFQSMLDPLIVSWGYQALFPGPSQFIDYHQMNGTRDLTAFCTLPTALAFMQEQDWPSHAASCRSLAQSQVTRFTALLNTSPLALITDEFFGQMASIEVPTTEPEKMKNDLYHRYKIEIPVMRQGSKNYIRYSIQVFNTIDDLDHLYQSLEEYLQELK
jgi:isopenicillin-N epimerase